MVTILKQLAAVQELNVLDLKSGHHDLLTGDVPIVLRGLVQHWPIVAKASESIGALANYLLQFDSGQTVEAMLAAPAEKGRLFYGKNLQQFNFKFMQGRFSDAFEILSALQHQSECPTFYIGSTAIADYLPGLERECALDFLSNEIIPNIWIGNRTRVATHNDDAQNIACIAAGRRKFTLFPPNQEPNLYIADTNISPGGRPISLVDLNAPDMVRFPDFARAANVGLVTILNPGDALYIPTKWWHNVEALEPVNILINYWWKGLPPVLATTENKK